MTKNLLVIYEKSGEEWAAYLKELLTSHLQIDNVFLYDVSCESNETVGNFTSSAWQCKLLVLTRDILKIFYESQSTNFFKLLQPSYRVVLMLCGVNSPEGLYELFSLERDCHVILPDQDPQDYISIVSTVLNEDSDDRNINWSLKTTQTSTQSNIGQEEAQTVEPPTVLVIPRRVLCENPGELFIILSKEIPKNTEVEVELCTRNQLIRKKPIRCGEKILCLQALYFPPGEVTVNVCFGEVVTASAQIEYFSTAEKLQHLLLNTIDPVAFICQAFNVYTLEKLDKVLMKSLKNKISSPECNLHELTQHRISGSSEEIPTLLHCAAKLGLKEVAHLLTQSPAAEYFCRTSNKYGDDPAEMAEKYGHKEIRDMIHQVIEKQKANQTDIVEEPVEFEQENVYVDMDECADHQKSSKDSCANDDETEVEPVNEAEREVLEYAIEENIEKNVEHVEYNGSEIMLDMTNDYYHLLPADSTSRPLRSGNTFLQDEIYKKDQEETLYTSDHSSEQKDDWQNTNCDQNSKYCHENIYLPMLIHSITEDLPIKEDHECLTAILHPQHDVSVEQNYYQDKDIVKENMSQGTYDECPEEQALNEFDEEPVLSTSTEDDVCITFENSIKERRDDNEYGSRGEMADSSDRENNSEHDEEPVIIASTEDDVYLVFETSVKKKQRGQTSFTLCDPTRSEAESNSTIGRDASYHVQEERRDDNELVSHGELDDSSDEGNDPEHDEEPLIIASTEDDVYLVFESSVKKKQKGQTSFTSYNPALPEAASNSTIGSGASYLAQAEEKDERFSTPVLWDEYECNEEDPYSMIYNDDDELYIELPYETAEEENPRGRKSFIVHRAPAPAPRPQTSAPDIEDSYISKVFRKKEEEKKIYSTGFYQDKMQLTKHEPQVPPQQYALSGQDELILLQEKVKMGIISVDEALQKFQQWQNEKSELDLLQQKKLQQLRDNIIGDKTDDERVYDKITIVHQPNAFPVKKKTTFGKFDNSIYQKPNKPTHLPAPNPPIKKDNETYGKMPRTK